jgi:3'-phosphoadenosine 5'-phosphosulfate (PAPS) 3'-phosphatase
MNQTFTGVRGNALLVQISYTDVFGVRQTVQKQVAITSRSSFGSTSSSTSSSGTQNSFSRNFNGQSQSSDSSSNSLAYIAIGAAGIIIVIGIIQLGRKKKLPHFSKLFKGRKE